MRTPSVPPGTSTVQRSGAAGAGPVPHGECRGGDPGAAAEGLADAALEHAHADGADAVAHQRVARHHELDVGAVAASSGCRCGRDGEFEAVELVGAGERDDDVRIADVDAEARDAATPRPAGAHEDLVAARRRHAPEIDLEPARRCASRSCTPARVPIRQRDRHRAAARARVDEVAREDADAVAAHLGLRAVGVAVVHEPFGARLRQRPAPSSIAAERTTRRMPSAPMPKRRSQSTATWSSVRSSSPSGSGITTKSLPVPCPFVKAMVCGMCSV